MNIALHVIETASVLFFSQEMSSKSVAARGVAVRSQVPLSVILGARKLRNASDANGDDEVGRLAARSHAVTAGELWIDDASNLSAADLTARVRRAVQRQGIRLVVVDYLQRMQHDRRAGDSISSRVGDTVMAIKHMALDCRVPVLCLAQLNGRTSTAPTPRRCSPDLRDSGQIEQEADAVLLLHPEDRPDDGERPSVGTVTVLIEKNRNGPTGVVKLDYVRRFTEFRSQVPTY